jgi:hypothetical protein
VCVCVVRNRDDDDNIWKKELLYLFNAI